MRRLKKGMSAQKEVPTARIAAWYLFGNVLVKGMAFLSTPIFTRMMSKVEYGSFSNFVSWQNLLVVIITLDFTSAIAPAKYDYDGEMDQYLSSVFAVSCLSVLATYAVVWLYRGYFVKLFSMEMNYIHLMFLYILGFPAFSYLQVKHRIYREYRVFVILSVLSASVSMALSVWWVYIMPDKLYARTLGYVLPATILNLALGIYILAKGKTIRLDMVRYALTIAVPLVPHAVSGILLGNSDRIMITKYVGNDANAMYTLAYQVSLMANMIWTSMNQAWAPWLYDHIHTDSREAIRQKSKIYLLVFVFFILGALLIAPELMLVLGGAPYYNARFVIPPVILGCAFQFVYGMYVNIEIYEKRTVLISMGTVLAALLNIGLNRLFIPAFGYLAAAYTTLAGYAALLLFHYLIVKIKIPYLFDIYEHRWIAAVLLSLTAAGGIALLSYCYGILRCVLLLLFLLFTGAMAYKHRKELSLIWGFKSRR